MDRSWSRHATAVRWSSNVLTDSQPCTRGSPIRTASSLAMRPFGKREIGTPQAYELAPPSASWEGRRREGPADSPGRTRGRQSFGVGPVSGGGVSWRGARRSRCVRQPEQPPERVDTVKELEGGPDRHRRVGDGLGIRVLAAMTVVGQEPGREREDQRPRWELHDRIGPGKLSCVRRLSARQHLTGAFRTAWRDGSIDELTPASGRGSGARASPAAAGA